MFSVIIIFLSKLWVDGISKVFSHILPNLSRSIKDEYQYLQQSSLPTMHFQASLPRLPVPKLEDTCKKYLMAQEAILSPEEYEQTSKNVAAFLLGEGPQLHKKLLEIDAQNKHTSYISEPWFDMYLRDRKPLPINFNPWMSFYQEKNRAYNIPLVKATNILISSARFIRSLRAGLLEPEIFHLNKKKSNTKFFRRFIRLIPSRLATYGAYLFKAFPLDMSQINHLFGTSRIPQIGKDRISNDPDSRHVLVMRRGHFYTFDILNEEGSIRSPHQIASCVNSILNDPRPPNSCPIGVLTTTERNQWARNRQHLIDLGNGEIVEKIDTALFLLAFDDDNLLDGDFDELLKTFLHSDGTNRWFDKSFTLLVTGAGWSAINFEHSWGDGVVVIRFCQDMRNDVMTRPRFHPEEQSQIASFSPDVEKLELKIDDFIQQAVNTAFKEYKHWTERLFVKPLLYNGFGRKQCKIAGVSPDAVMQLAFQLAFYKLEKCTVGTYEACSTSAFIHGRTETIRSCTNQTKALCKAIVESGISQVNNSKYKKMMIECSKTHTALTKEAAMGQGFDRHMFMLGRIAQENESGDLPEIFKDTAYSKLTENILSTSTLTTSVIMGGGFGPVVEHGYGIGYTIDDTDNGIRLSVTSYNDRRDGLKYLSTLKSSLDEIYKILQSE